MRALARAAGTLTRQTVGTPSTELDESGASPLAEGRPNQTDVQAGEGYFQMLRFRLHDATPRLGGAEVCPD